MSKVAAPAPAPVAATPARAPAAAAAAAAPAIKTEVRFFEAPAASAPEAPSAPPVDRWDGIKARAGLPSEAGEAAEATTTEATPPPTDWDSKFAQTEKPKVTNATERLKAKAQREAEARSAEALQRQIQERDAQLQQFTRQQQDQQAKFHELMQRGDADGAMKVLGTGLSFEEMTRQVLIAKGALQPQGSADPRVDALLQQQQEQLRQQQEWQWRQQQEQLRAQQQREWNENVELMQQELASYQDIPDATGFAKLPGVAEDVFRRVHEGLQQDPNYDPQRAAWETDRNYRALYESLHEHYGKRGGAQQMAATAPPPVNVAPEQQSASRGTRPTSPAAKMPEGVWGESRWEYIKRNHPHV